MNAPGGDRGEPYRDQPGPWQQYQHPPVDPQAPVNYPEYPYPAQYPGQPPAPPPYGPSGYGGPPPPPPYPGPGGYGAPPPMAPMYAGPYDPYQAYPSQTNSLAIGSLITSIAGIPMTFVCYLGLPCAIVGIVLGIVALNQIKRTNQPGRGLAIAGIAIGVGTAVLLVLLLIMVAAASFHAPMFGVV